MHIRTHVWLRSNCSGLRRSASPCQVCGKHRCASYVQCQSNHGRSNAILQSWHEPHQVTGWCTQPSGEVSTRAAVMGEPALLQLSTKSCRRLAACRACCSIRGASVSARQHMSVSTLHQHPDLLRHRQDKLLRMLEPGSDSWTANKHMLILIKQTLYSPGIGCISVMHYRGTGLACEHDNLSNGVVSAKHHLRRHATACHGLKLTRVLALLEKFEGPLSQTN